MFTALVVIGILLIAQCVYILFIRKSQGDGDIGIGALSILGGGIGIVAIILSVILKVLGV